MLSAERIRHGYLHRIMLQAIIMIRFVIERSGLALRWQVVEADTPLWIPNAARHVNWSQEGGYSAVNSSRSAVCG